MRWTALAAFALGYFGQIGLLPSSHAQQPLGQGSAEIWSGETGFFGSADNDPAPSPFAEKNWRHEESIINRPDQEPSRAISTQSPAVTPAPPTSFNSPAQPAPPALSSGSAAHSNASVQGLPPVQANPIYPTSAMAAWPIPNPGQGDFGMGHPGFAPHSQLLAVMQCNENGNVWCGYAEQRAAETAHRLRHVHGNCDCVRMAGQPVCLACGSAGSCQHGCGHHGQGHHGQGRFNRYTQSFVGGACGASGCGDVGCGQIATVQSFGCDQGCGGHGHGGHSRLHGRFGHRHARHGFGLHGYSQGCGVVDSGCGCQSGGCQSGCGNSGAYLDGVGTTQSSCQGCTTQNAVVPGNIQNASQPNASQRPMQSAGTQSLLVNPTAKEARYVVPAPVR